MVWLLLVRKGISIESSHIFASVHDMVKYVNKKAESSIDAVDVIVDGYLIMEKDGYLYDGNPRKIKGD